MHKYARLNALLDAMAAQGHVDVDEMARRFEVAPSTVRRDLNHLTEQQMVTRTRGGAVATTVSYDLPLRYKAAKRQPEKSRIGQAAAALVLPGDNVCLNGGTTTTEVARCVATNEASAQGRQITILTNAINIAGELTVRRHVRLVMTGGTAKPQSFELVGPLATDTLRQLAVDVAIIGVDALDPDGAKAADSDEAEVNRMMVERSRKVVLVADSSKFGARAFARICGWADVHTLITDAEVRPDDLEPARQAGVEIQVV